MDALQVGAFTKTEFQMVKFLSPQAQRAPVMLLAVALVGCSSGHAAPDAARPRGLQVVELFQSQGCSSCPPANRNVMALTNRTDTLVLSWQVTYWDYLGWKDRFAKPAFTERQRAYSRALGHEGVWTPQVVINGKGDVVGSNSGELQVAMRRYARQDENVRARIEQSKAIVAGKAEDASVYLVRFDPRLVQVPIRAGENQGRTLPHRNVVKELIYLGRFSGGVREWTLPPAGEAGLRTALLVQKGRAGPVLAAADDQ